MFRGRCSLRSTSLLFLLFLSKTLADDQGDRDAATLKYYRDHAPDPYYYPKVQMHECGDSTLPNAVKLIKDGGEELINKQHAKGKDVYVIMGPYDNGKTLLANTFGGLDLNAQPIQNIGIYPRFVAAKDNSTVIIEAPNLGSSTAEGHITGIYLLNKMLENSTGVKLIYAHNARGILQMWYYFSRTSEVNPDIGMFQLSKAESFTLTMVDPFGDGKIESMVKSNKFKWSAFGRHPSLLLKKPPLENQLENSRKVLDETYAKMEFVPVVRFPVLVGYQPCIRLHKKIEADLKKSTQPILEHFKSVEKNTTMSDNDKFEIFNSALNTITDITSDINEEMNGTTVPNALSKMAEKLGLEKVSKDIIEIGYYGELLITIQKNYMSKAWTEGIKDLEEYLSKKSASYEMLKSIGASLAFDCIDTIKVKHLEYELEFEIDAKTVERKENIMKIFNKYQEVLGANIVNPYKEFVEGGHNAENVEREILTKLKAHDDNVCMPKSDKNNAKSGSCDDAATKEIVELLGKGSVNETHTDDRIVLVLGNEKSKKIQVANLLANFQVDSPTNFDPLVYTEFLNKPDNATYGVVSAPDMSNDKSPAKSIVGSFFTHRSMQSAIAVKVVITLEEKSISGEELENTFEDVIRVILGADNVNKCVAFVITGVELSDGEKLSDKSKSIASTLIGRLEKMSTSEKASNNTKTFLKMFLADKDQASKQVGIFQNAEKLSKSETFSENRNHLIGVIDMNLQFTSYETKDFLNQLKENEKGLAACAAQKTMQRITEIIDDMFSEVENVLRSSEDRKDGDYTEVFARMDNASERIAVLIYNTTEYSSIETTILPMIDFMAYVEVKSGTAALEKLDIDVSYTNVLDISNAQSFSAGLNSTLTYIEDSRRWYYFLGKLETLLTEFKIMVKRDDYKSASSKLLASIRLNSAQRQDVDTFINSIGDLPKEALKKLLGKIDPTLKQLRYLGYMIDRMFTTQMSVDCSEEVNVCQGTYVTVSSCMENLCMPGRSIDIHATNVVYVDVDLNENSTAVTIIAPEWHIIGQRMINLDGKNAPSPAQGAAKKGSAANVKGEDGKPGLPGDPGGNFLGVARTFIYRENGTLTISAKGGRGSDGQRGGEGGPGSKPEKPTFCEACDDASTMDFSKQGFSATKYCDKRNGASTVCRIFMGKDGGKAAAGGNGGAAGIGGITGSIKLVSVDNVPVNAEINAEPGKNGAPGEGGYSGLYIRGYFAISEETVHWAFTAATYRYRLMRAPDYEYKHRNGDFGKKGANEEKMKMPQGPKPPPSLPVSLNRCKNFYRDIVSRKMKNLAPLQFYSKIEFNDELNAMYNTTSLADDFQRLEKQSIKLKKRIQVAPYFESFLTRIANFSGSGKHNDEVKKTLAFLYTAVLSSLAADTNREGVLVVNIPKFLKKSIESMEALKALENDKIVQSYKDEYVENVQKSTDEANNLIENEIKPIVDNYKNEMDTQIENLSKEVTELKKQTKLQKEALYKKKEHLRKTLIWRKAMSVVGGVVSLMSFMGPAAGAVGSAINAGARIAESIVLSDNGDPTAALVAIPGAVNQQLTTVIQLIENKKSRMSDQLAEIESRLTSLGGTGDDKNLKDIKEKVTSTKSELAKIDPKKLDPNALKTINSLQAGMKKTLDDRKLAISKYQANDDRQDRKINAIGYMQAIVNGGDIIARDVARYRQTAGQLDEVNQQIQQSEETLRKLDRYEENIHSQMMPMINNIKDRVDDLQADSKGKSHAALDVAQWKAAEYFADMRITLKTMTSDFKMSEGLENVMNKVDRGMEAMMKVYHRIQDNQDKHDLAVFIADINSNKASEINVKDRYLNGLLSDIQISIHRHIILERFERGFKAFTQVYMPFGAVLLGEFSLPNKLTNINSTEATVTFAQRRLREMIAKIQDTEITITNYDNYVYNGYPFLEGDSEIAPPFYTWKYEDHSVAISKLFQGETIELNADIFNLPESLKSRYTIKFNGLRLVFLTRDESEQGKINKVLDDFFIRMTSLGSNHYACNEKYFEISNKMFTLRMTYKLGNGGTDPFGPNDVYKKLKENAAMFSPYGKWNITIDSKNVESKMAQFIGMPVDIQMVGYGYYVDQETDICETDLDTMYNRIQ